MNDDQQMTAAEQSARDALESHAMEGNIKAVAVLAESASPLQQAEHIRGVVAATMAHYSSEASAATQAHAAKWRAWALGLIEKLDAPAQLAGDPPRA
ncbi:MAG TPA: hypothetical protein VD932_01605 [Aquabacterium sp.]|nr:hypothetical protein [Aquabacterium sp.]